MIELLTAVAVTAVIISVLIGMTRVAVDTWSSSRDKTKAARVAKESLDKIARDLEGIVVRSGNNFEWAFVKSDSSNSEGPTVNSSMTNPTEMLFFTGATDRYDGEVGGNSDLGGDISTVAYRLAYQDQLNPEANDFPVFALYRNLVNPDETFDQYLAQEDLLSRYSSKETLDSNNFLVENIFDLTITFIFQYEDGNGLTRFRRVPVIATGDIREVRIYGDRVEVDGSELVDDEGNPIVSLYSAELSMMVLSDLAMSSLDKQPIKNDKQLAEYLRKNGHHYSKSVILPRS